MDNFKRTTDDFKQFILGCATNVISMGHHGGTLNVYKMI